MNVSHARLALLAVAATTLLSSACSNATYPTRESARDNAATQILVANHNWMDMTVYALRDQNRVRLGTVTSGTAARFRLPRGLDLGAGMLRLQADPVGSTETFTSEPISVDVGSVVNWTIENHIALSSYYISSR
jgi:hypothetical protein